MQTTKHFSCIRAEYVTPEVLFVASCEDGVICDSLISGDGDITGVTSDDWGEF